MKRIFLVMLICPAMVFFSSCTALPAEERAFAVALCLEKQEEVWRVNARIPAYRTGEYLTVSGESGELAAALANMNASAPMAVSLSQLRLLVMSEQLVRQEISEAFRMLGGQYDVRQQCVVAMTGVPAKEAADAMNPDAGARLSKTIDVMVDAQTDRGLIPEVRLADIIRMEERQTPVLIQLKINEGRIDLSGVYVVGGDDSILLSPDESALMTLLLGDTAESSLLLNQTHIDAENIRVNKRLTDDLKAAHIQLKLRVQSEKIPRGTLEQTLADACVHLLSRLSANGCDPLGMGQHAALQTRDEHVWEELYWPDKVRELQWAVSVQIEGPA